jgi:hypothetical protein
MGQGVRELMKTHKIAWLVVGLAGMAVFGGAANVLASPALPPALTTADLARFHITSAVDVTSVADTQISAAAGAVAPAISRADALAVAQDEAGSKDGNVRVLLAQAPLYPNQPDQPTWVFLFNGGVSPFDGPDGAPPVTFSETGVLVDATTGEFMRGFMH